MRNTTEYSLYHTRLERLATLRRRHFPEQGRFRELYVEAAECLRTYLNGQFGLDMKDRSLAELERVLRLMRGPSALFEEIRNFFVEYASVQSGQWLPSKKDAYQVPARVEALLEELAPAAIRQAHTKQVDMQVSTQKRRIGRHYIMPNYMNNQKVA
ncbi:MAG: hypothetical protein AAF702_01730 [Chloroflexota bacterium]